MKFESLEEIEQALHKKDLERQIIQEEIKNQYYHLKHDWNWTGNLFSKPIVTQLMKFGISYLIKRITR